MTDHELKQLEVELRQCQPAALPESLAARLRTTTHTADAPSAKVVPATAFSPNLRQLLRWLLPVAAVILVTAVIWQDKSRVTPPPAVTENHALNPANMSAPVFEADKVQIGRKLVSSFDAVATLPGGEPVRFRCRQWLDQVVVRDNSQGLIVENRTPRVEVVPVGFVTY